ncbi:hypothetical protein D5F01_LYC24787 [Larimichthys crocea]|uniref:Uncharacterized protein n=1 Tax=Larimichthys crocea TaxID=215358 RepID=A0A6G0HE56_LARCR|nr:hypothetical protein D5F01_LYC24787 [Larimichthys crocea]
MLSIGDIKAVWARTIGIPAMENILRSNGNAWMIDPNADGTEFNLSRTALWASLRKEYPIQVDLKALKSEPLTDTENPAAYISRQLKRWKQETEEDPENSLRLTKIFRNSIIEAMPGPVKSRLEDVVGNQEEEGRKQRPRREIGLDNINGVGDVTNLDITVETVLKIHGRLNRKKDGGLRVSPLKVGTPVRPIPGVGLNTGTKSFCQS